MDRSGESSRPTISIDNITYDNSGHVCGPGPINNRPMLQRLVGPPAGLSISLIMIERKLDSFYHQQALEDPN